MRYLYKKRIVPCFLLNKKISYENVILSSQLNKNENRYDIINMLKETKTAITY